MASIGTRAVGVDFGTSTSLVADRDGLERAEILPLFASTSATSGASLSPCRRPAKTVKPSAANFFAIAPPM